MYRTTHPSQMTPEARDAARRAAAATGSTFYRAKDGSCVIAVAYRTGRKGTREAIIQAWQGKALKSFYHYRVNAGAVPARLEQLFKDVAASTQYRAERRAANTPSNSGLQVGTILRCSWGYDQTNVDFYRVEALVGTSMVELVELPYIEVGEGAGSGWAGRCVPDIDAAGKKLGRFQVRNGSVRISSCQWANVWDGRPCYWSKYA